MTEELDRIELQEWIDSLDYVLRERGEARAVELLSRLQHRAAGYGLRLPHEVHTPYVNTIPRSQQPPYPGNRDIERRIKSIVRWNAMAMVVRANREESGIGGHISTYASAATLYEVAFNHFFHGPEHPEGGDQVYFQGHASPGIYARAFLEGRLSVEQLQNFRRELQGSPGLPSYPHPRLMPDFWQFPTVSMGLGPIMAIYQARFNRYLEDRGLKEQTGRVWVFIGDGEMDEPEALGALSLAGRAKLDNLIFVVNCNLQRLDGPVRGNSSIIQELETVFRGANWNVIKVIWGDDWDPLLEHDRHGLLVERMEELVDGDWQRYVAASGEHIREHFFGTHPELLELVKGYSDEQLEKLRRGGHDPEKVYAAYKAAVDHKGQPTVILAKTIKGYGLGEAGEGRNVTHQQKKLNEEEARHFRTRFGVPLSDDDIADLPFYRPEDDSRETQYLMERRRELGGSVPSGRGSAEPIEMPSSALFEELHGGSERPVATTMAFVRLLSKLMRDKGIGSRIVPIVPDEARTFGMDALFRQAGIYSHVGQRYEPIDRENLLYYKEATNGQILEEGITEAGSMASFIAAGSAYSTHGVATIPFFVFYSMFGFQRVGDLIWAAGDMGARGFLVGATAGRTTLAGEGLQHQDGHSHLLAWPHPEIRAYDPAFAYEIAVIVEAGLREMFAENQDLIYYLTVENEPYPMPSMPEDAREGIVRGMYRCRAADNKPKKQPTVHLLGSGAILNEALEARERLAELADIQADVWSVTSYGELLRDAQATDRLNRLNPTEAPQSSFVRSCLGDDEDTVIVAASDYVKALPQTLTAQTPGKWVVLGTEGFGRSDTRAALRDFFEVDSRHIAYAAISALTRQGDLEAKMAKKARKALDIDPDRPDPATP